MAKAGTDTTPGGRISTTKFVRATANRLGRLRKAFPRVKYIADLTAPIEIHVEAQDQKGARTLDHASCAMARACARELRADGAYVGLSKAYVVFGEYAVRCDVPESVSREVVSFDRRGGFSTGTYALSAVSEGNRLGIPKSQKRTGNGPVRRPTAVVHRTTRVRSAS